MLRKFYYGIATTKSGIKKYVGCDDNSGGYPYVSDYPHIYYDTKYLEGCKNDSYIKAQLINGEDFTITIVEVAP